jgi:hypothetical protein
MIVWVNDHKYRRPMESRWSSRSTPTASHAGVGEWRSEYRQIVGRAGASGRGFRAHALDVSHRARGARLIGPGTGTRQFVNLVVRQPTYPAYRFAQRPRWHHALLQMRRSYILLITVDGPLIVNHIVPTTPIAPACRNAAGRPTNSAGACSTSDHLGFAGRQRHEATLLQLQFAHDPIDGQEVSLCQLQA